MKPTLRTLFLVLALCGVPSRARAETLEMSSQGGHVDRVTGVSFSTDGKLLASSGCDGLIKVWDIETGMEIRSFIAHTAQVNGVKFIPNARLVVAGAWRGELKVWDTDTGTEKRSLKGHATHSEVKAVSLSADGKLLASVSRIHPWSGDLYEVKVWDMETGAEVNGFGGKGMMNGIGLSGDGKRLVYGGPAENGEGVLKVRDAKAGTDLLTCEGNLKPVLAVAFSPDGKFLASGGADETLKVWDAETGKIVHTIRTDAFLAQSMVFSSDGKFLACGASGVGPEVRVYDVQRGEEVRAFPSDGGVAAVAFNSDGTLLASGGGFGWMPGTLKVWDMQTGAVRWTLGGQASLPTELAFHPAGMSLACGTANGMVRLWDMRHARVVQALKGHSRAQTLAFSRDGRRLACGGSARPPVIRVWNLDTAEIICDFTSVQEARSACFNRDGSLLVTGDGGVGMSGQVMMWNVAGRQKIGAVRGHTSLVAALAVSPDGKLIASAQYGVPQGQNCTGKIEFTAMEGGGQVQTIDGYWDYGCVLSFSPDGKILACGGNRERKMQGAEFLVAFDVETGKQRQSFAGHASEVRAIRFTPDGQRILSASSDQTVRTWDVGTGKQAGSFSEARPFRCLAFDPTCRLFAAGSLDNAIPVWDVAAGKELARFVGLGEWGLLLTTGDGYYAASGQAQRFVAFRAGDTMAPAASFDLKYHRPDIVLQKLGCSSEALVEAYRKAYAIRLQQMKFAESAVTATEDLHVPQVAVASRDVPSTTDKKKIQLKIKASDAKSLLDRLRVSVNGVPLAGRDGIDLREDRARTVEREVNLDLFDGMNRIEFTALNERGVESPHRSLEILCTSPRPTPDVYVLAVGVSEYPDARYRLKYAAKDANDFAGFLDTSRGTVGKVNVLKLLDADVNQEGLLKVKSFLRESRADDVVVVFLSGHAILTGDQELYLATADTDFADPSGKGMSMEWLERLLASVPARRRFTLLNFCFPGEADEGDDALMAAGLGVDVRAVSPFQELRDLRGKGSALGFRDRFRLAEYRVARFREDTGSVVLFSLSASEFAVESKESQNGTLVHAMIQGVRSRQVDTDQDGEISGWELLGHMSRSARQLTNGLQLVSFRTEEQVDDSRFPLAETLGLVVIVADNAPIYRGQAVVAKGQKGEGYYATGCRDEWFGIIPVGGWVHRNYVDFVPGPKACLFRKALPSLPQAVSSICFTLDGKSLLVTCADNLVRVLDADTGKVTKTFQGHTDRVTCTSLSPDGATLASGSQDNSIRLWDVQAGTQVGALEKHSHDVLSVGFSPDGTFLASGGADRTAKFYGIRTEGYYSVQAHTAKVNSVYFSGDGKYLATAGDDSLVKLWDVSKGQEAHVLKGHEGPVNALSVWNWKLASGSQDKSVRIWDTRNGRFLVALQGHGQGVSCVTFRKDGAVLASGSDDQTVRIWDAVTGRATRTLTGHTGLVTAVAFSPDGRLLASGSTDKTIRLWWVGGH